MKIKTKASIIIIIGLMVVVTPQYIPANDAPHNASNNISCGSCHGETILNSPFWGGSVDGYDQICLWKCHTAPFGPYTDESAPRVQTHSYLTADPDPLNPKYGIWIEQCRNCHDPHYQRQKNYKTTDSSRLYLAAGTITSCNYYDPDNYEVTYFDPDLINKSILTYSTITYKSGWDYTKLTVKTGDYRRTILFPNVNKLGYSYPVIAIDEGAQTITVTGDASPVYQYIISSNFAVIYGQYVKDSILTNEATGTYSPVKLFDQTGANSFADGDSTYNGVCEVCHTRTDHYRNADNAGSAPDQHHSNIGGTDGKNCSTCHSHVDGFKPSCASCHGYPPPPLASIPLPTGSTIAGEHIFHVTTMGYQCSVCHSNSVGSGTTHSDNKVTLGFVGLIGSYTGGSYDGQASANYESSDPGTTVSNSGARECSNIYCHGGTMAPDGGTASAIWDIQTSADCGTCHGATTVSPPTRGSHTKHAGERQMACTICHSSYAHVNGSVEWAYDTAIYPWLSGALYRGVASGSGAPVPSLSYGQCSNLYCHSIVQTSTGGALTPDTSDYKTPTWGQTFSGTCGGGACHAAGNAHPGDTGFVALASGSHQEHLLYRFDQVGNCQACHYDPSYDDCVDCHSRTVKHVDHSIDVEFNPGFPMLASSTSGTYSGDPVPGNGFGSCSSLYCHSPGTKADAPYDSPNTTNITWGATPLPDDCTGCHNGDNNATNKLSTGSHLKHILSYDCSLCHKYTVSNSRTLNPTLWGTKNYTHGHRYHVDGWITLVFDSTAAVAGTYAGQASPITFRAPGAAYGICTNITCHNDGTGVWTGGTGVGSTPAWGTTGGCNSCHGNTAYSDYRKGTPLYASSPTGTKPNAHQLHTDVRITPSGEPQCSNCHRSVTNTNTAIDGTTPSDHANNVYSVVAGNTYKDGDNVGGAAVSVATTYSYSGTPNTSTCSNVSCHPTGIAGTKSASTTKWSNAYSCTDCHKINMNNTTGYHHVMDSTAMADRTYPASVPASNADDANRKCTMCHVDHNIFSPMLNANNTNGRSYNLRTAIGTTPNASSGYTNSDYATGGGICISCHTNELAKNTSAQKPDGTTVTVAVTDAYYSPSLHQYNVELTMTDGSSTFNANCSKCHNAKNNETTTFQSSTNKFGVHDSTARRLVAALGGTLVENYEEAFCYRCHSKAADGIGGTKKSADTNDWYGAVTNMSAPSTSMYQGFQKTYKHNVAGYSGLHKPSPTDETRTYLSANKHVECNDCHNPHAARAGLHSSNQVHVAARTNLISDSGPLTGAVGAEPTWSSSNWGGASSWPTTTSTATKEYQICFKCHADYNTNPSGWNSANIDWINTTGPSAWTNVALEFNPNNQSYHPVVQSLPVTDPGDNGSSRLHPAFISLMIGDSGSATIPSTYDSLTDTAKSWTANQWQNWGVRIGYKNYSNRDVYNNIRRITSNTTDTLTVDAAFQGTYAILTSDNSYSIEYYAGRGTKAGTTVTDMNKNFNLYLSSLVGYVVVVLDDVGMYAGKGTVVSNTATSFTVGGWTSANTLWPPGDGSVNYYFSASGRTMMCSDCHSNDVISSTAAQGPHGSAIKWMLKGRNKAWPETSASGFGELRILGSTNNFYDNDGKTNGLFCLNCHPTISFVKDSYGLQSNNSYYNIHLRHGGRPCVRCHIVIPHGGKMSRLIGDNDSTMPARYAYDNNLSGMWVTSFLKADGPASYSPGDNHCTTICHHGASGGGNPAWENW